MVFPLLQPCTQVKPSPLFISFLLFRYYSFPFTYSPSCSLAGHVTLSELLLIVSSSFTIRNKLLQAVLSFSWLISTSNKTNFCCPSINLNAKGLNDTQYCSQLCLKWWYPPLALMWSQDVARVGIQLCKVPTGNTLWLCCSSLVLCPGALTFLCDVPFETTPCVAGSWLIQTYTEL